MVMDWAVEFAGQKLFLASFCVLSAPPSPSFPHFESIGVEAALGNCGDEQFAVNVEVLACRVFECGEELEVGAALFV